MAKTAGKPAMMIAEQTPDVAPDGLVASGRTLQRVQSQYTTAIAVQKPRVLEKVQAAILREAELAGDSFFYSWTTKNKDGSRGLVEGISIDGAQIMARNWGNCATDVGLEDDAPQHWIIGAAFIDHETGYTGKRLFRQRKGESHGRFDADRAQDIAFQIGQSKAIRNVVVNSMPGYIKDRALEKAKAAAEAAIQDLPKFIDSWVTWFAKGRVTEPMLVWKLGLPKKEWTKREAVMLRALAKAIIDRQTSIANEFEGYDDPSRPQAQSAEPAQASTPDKPAPETIDTTAEDVTGERPDFE